MTEKYFLFSSTQLNFRKKAEEKLGRKFKPGYVIVNGRKLLFTELSINGPEKSRYSDSKKVFYGDPSKVKYVMPGSD